MEVAERGDNLVQKGSVKAALSLFGEKLGEGNAKWKKTNLLNLEKERELSVVKMDGNKFTGRQKGAERVKFQAESKIFAANKMGETLNPQTQFIRTNIDREFQSVKVFIEQKGGEVLESGVYPNNQYTNEMKKELELEKENIRNLKQNISYALQMKSKAEMQANEAIAKAREYSISENILRNRIEEANEELVLVELAKIEATKELRQAEAERESNAALFSYKMAEAQNKIIELLHELSFSKDLETVLELTNSEIEVLQNELRFCKAMEEIEGKALKRTQSSLAELISRTEEEDLSASSKLASSITELDQAEKELKGLREEGFHVMTSMDIIRNELKQTSSETARWKGLKDQSEYQVECLDSKLLKARKELEIATKAEGNAKSIHSNLLATLTQLRTETDDAKNENQATDKEIQKIRSEIQATRIATNESKQRLQAALQDLEKIKAAEMVALENLSILSEKTVMARAASSQRSLTITISSFEFEYLTARAQGADEIANKKVAAAKASVDAIRYSEKEIVMKTESAEREIAELKMAQEQQLDAIGKTLAEKKVLEAELNKWKMHDSKKQQFEEPLPNKHIREYGRTTSVRRTRAYRTPSPAHWNYARSPSFSMKKKKKKMVIPSLVRLFSGKKFQKFPYRN